MLRSIMSRKWRSARQSDQAFIDMMHDFIDTYRNTPASTESFKLIVEKHMTKEMDLQRMVTWTGFSGNGYMARRFRATPSNMSLSRPKVAKSESTPRLPQSEVDENFAMIVPVYANFGNGMVRLGQIPIAGNSTRKVDFVLDQQPKKVALNAYKDILER